MSKWLDLENRIEELEAENVRLTRMLTEPEFLRAEVTKGMVEADMRPPEWLIRTMVGAAAEAIGDAKHYVEFCLGDKEDRFVVTIKRFSGRTPTEIHEEQVRQLQDTAKILSAQRVALHAENERLKHEVEYQKEILVTPYNVMPREILKFKAENDALKTKNRRLNEKSRQRQQRHTEITLALEVEIKQLEARLSNMATALGETPTDTQEEQIRFIRANAAQLRSELNH